VEAASAGPVVVLNVSQWRCDAIVLTIDGIQTVALPGLSHEHARRRVELLLGGLRDFDDALMRFERALAENRSLATAAAHSRIQNAGAARHETYARANAVLLDTLEWLWECVALPLLRFMPAPSGSSTPPRVWWCPTGPLTMLPIHAAGRFTTRNGSAPTGGEWLIDRVTSSYAPTVRSLIDARRPGDSDGDPAFGDDQFLLVSPGQGVSVGVAESPGELDKLARVRLTRLVGTDATVAAVSKELRRSKWVHFDSHADQDLREPSLGGLELFDGRLTIYDVGALQLRGEFAGLAACKTGQGGLDLPDESINLAAAMHHIGYRHVVASLWSIGDSTASEVFAALYQRLGRTGTFNTDDSAPAVAAETQRLKAQNPADPHLWASLVHVGP
jgi:hypothetical protein